METLKKFLGAGLIVLLAVSTPAWSIDISCDRAASNIENLLPFRRSVPKDAQGIPTNRQGLPRSTILRARWINFSSAIGSIEEGGAGHAGANAFQLAGKASSTVVESNSTSTDQATEPSWDQLSEKLSRFNTPSQQARAERVAQDQRKALEKARETDASQPSPGNLSNYLPRLFTLANQTLIRRGDGRSLIGIRFQTIGPDGARHEHTIRVEVRLNSESAEEQERHITILSTNLAYAALRDRHEPVSFFRHLTQDLSGTLTNGKPIVEILSVKAEGPRLEALARAHPADHVPHSSTPWASDPRSQLELMGYAANTVYKASSVGETSVVAIEEVGAGHAVGNLFHYAGAHPAESNVAQAQEAVVIRFNEGNPIPGSSISKKQLELKLDHSKTAAQRKRAEEIATARHRKDVERHHQDPRQPAPKRMEHYLPPLMTIANTTVTSAGNGKSWVGIQMQTRLHNGQMEDNRIMVEVRMLSENTEKQKLQIATISANLAHAASRYRSHPERFAKALVENLEDRLPDGRRDFEVTTVVAEGEGVKDLAQHQADIALDLIGDGEVFFNTGSHATNGVGKVESDSAGNLFRRRVVVVQEDLLPETPPVLETSGFQTALAELAAQEKLSPTDFTIVSEIAVAPGFEHRAATEKISELDVQHSAVVVTTNGSVVARGGTTAWGATSVHFFANGKLTLVPSARRR